MSSSILLITRLFGVLAYGYSIYFQNVRTNPLIFPVWGKMKFLTYWDLLLQFGFFTTLFLTQSVFRIRSKTLTNFLGTIFYGLAFPLSVIVAVTFWGIYAVDRELIFPVEIEKYYPVWLNHSTHTLIVALTAIEVVLGGHRMPRPKCGLTLLLSFNATYLACLLYLATVHDHWVYPIFRVLDWPQRIAFFVASILFNFVTYYIGVGLAKSQGCQLQDASGAPSKMKKKTK